MARRAGIEGTVILEVSIDEEGKVIAATLKRGLGYECDEAALEAIWKARFYPARADDGRPVAVKVPIPFHFRIVD
jgi:protein TonB